MKSQIWERIINDYTRSGLPFSLRNDVLDLFIGKSKTEKSDVYILNTFGETVNSLLNVIFSTRMLFEENKDENKVFELKSIHRQSITMLENVLLINSKKISS